MYAVALLLRLPALPEDELRAWGSLCIVCLFVGIVIGTLAVYAIMKKRERELTEERDALRAELEASRGSSSDSPS